MEKARARVCVSGHVQGVFFRAFAEEVARSHGLTGWVRNMSDGRVEALFEGERQGVERAVSSLRSGPPAARVEDVEVRWEDFTDEFGSFSVRYF
jgi:acylphosphatase